MAITRPTGEQIRFSSSKTGDHILDTYMEMVERGTRTLYELLDDIFDPDTGQLFQDFIQIRVNDSTQELQYRSGQHLDPEENWQNSGEYILRHRGAWSASTDYKQFDIVTHNNGSYICQADHTSTLSFDSVKFAVLVDASYVSSYATNALASQNAAAISETNAAASEIAAAASEANVISLYDSFDDRYLGSKSSAPSVDNDGNSIAIGAIYWNSTSNSLFIWDGTQWDQAAFNVSGDAVTSFNGRDGAVTLETSDVTTALGFTPQQYDADTAKTDTAQQWSAGQYGTITPLTDASTITADFSASNHFSVTLGDNRTMGNPTNANAGQSGFILIAQDATGSRTLAYDTNWKFAGGNAPTLSTTPDAIDRIDYVAVSPTVIHAVLTRDWK